LTLGHANDLLGFAVLVVEVGLLITKRAKSGRDIVSDGKSLPYDTIAGLILAKPGSFPNRGNG
jgi:hypothetical protein